jgi:hypothetical protein
VHKEQGTYGTTLWRIKFTLTFKENKIIMTRITLNSLTHTD